MTQIDIPDHLIPAIDEIVRTFATKSKSYGNAAGWAGMFRWQSDHLDVPPREVADIFELTKLSRLRELRLAAQQTDSPAKLESLFEQYRDKAVFAVIALALFLYTRAETEGAQQDATGGGGSHG